jgi:hypothetical protein
MYPSLNRVSRSLCPIPTIIPKKLCLVAVELISVYVCVCACVRCALVCICECVSVNDSP